MLQLLCIVTSLNSRLEYINTSRNVPSGSLWIISAYGWVSLLEVNVNCDRFHEVQWIILIEWQSKASL